MANGTKEGTLVNVKRVRRDTDKGGRDKLVLTFGTDKEGKDGLVQLIDALEQYRGKQVNFDIRVQEKQASNGSTFDSAFVIIKEMIPKDQAQTTYVPKNTARATTVKASADKIRKQFE